MPVQLGKVAGTEHRDPAPAAPHVRRLAREIGIDIHNVKGSGPGGRISEDDVKLARRMLLRPQPPLHSLPAELNSSNPNFPTSPNGARSNAFRSAECAAKPPNIFGKPGTRFRTSPNNDNADITELEQLRAVSRRKPKKPAAR